MNTGDVAKKLVDLCKQGKNMEAMDALYAKDIVSIEAIPAPGMEAEIKGFEAVKGKSKWWEDNHIIHSAVIEGPYVNHDKFAVRFKYDITNKKLGKRMMMDEIGIYLVTNGKVSREEFYYGG